MNWSLLLPSTWNPLISIHCLLVNPETQALSDVFIHLIIGISLFFSLWAIKLTVSSYRETRRYLRPPGKYEDAVMKTESSAPPLFREFQRHLLRPPKRDGTDERSSYRTVDAAEIFRDSALAPNFTTSRLFLAMPGILTGLGVLGTFIGLQIGIGGLDLKDVKNLETSIVPLIQGCVVAFSTSVWGVFSSLLFSFLEKLLGGWAIGKIRELQNKIDTLIPRYDPEKAMDNLEQASQGTKELLTGLAVAIGDEMQKAIGRLGTEIKDAVAQATNEGQGPLAEKSAELLGNALTAELVKIKEQINRIEPSVTTLSDTVTAEKSIVTEAVNKLNAHEAVMEKMASAATEIQQAAEAFAETRETMELSAENNKKAAEAQSSAAQANKRVAEKFNHVGERLPEIQKTLEEAARVIASISGPLAELKSHLEQLPVEQEKFQKDITASNTEQSRILLDMVNDLAGKVGRAAEQFSKVDRLAGKLAEAATRLDDASNELAVFGSQVLDASKEQRDASTAARAAALAGERTANALEPIPGEIRTLTTGLQTAGDSLRTGAEAASKSYRDLIALQNQWFSGAETGLNAIKDRLQSIIDAYGGQIEGQTKNLMNLWTSEVRECLQKYDTQVATLHDDLDELQSFLNRFRKN